MKYLLGIDFGGGASKATLLSEEGKIVAENTVEYPTYYEESSVGEVIVSAGVGVLHEMARVRAFAEELGAELCASRRMVDEGEMPYAAQVGLTGRTVAPPVYIAIGISGAVHHVAGMSRAGTFIAINSDKNAPIFEYADFGVLEEF